MSIRKIKDAKDLNNNELIYFKGHAKATYMSDGSTVEDAIKSIETNSGNIDLSDYETKLESQAKLQEAKDYTDTKIAELQEGVVTQIIELNQGYNWVSFYVKTSLQDLQSALGNKATLIGTSDNGTSTINIKAEYNSETNTWSGNLTELNYTSMYQIYCSEACSIELKGAKLNSSELEYTIVPGTTWISYPLDKELSIAEALVGLSCAEGDLLKSHNNVAQYYNEYGWYAFDLQPMIPGKGYMYVNTTNEIKTFYFPSNEEENSDFETKDDALVKLKEAKDYTDTAIANLVDSAPETLNTLNELAVAIQENEDIIEVLNQSIGSKQDTITDLETIRQGAAKGATALLEHQDISGKADIEGNPNGIVVKEDNPQNSINIRPYGMIESESWKYNNIYSTEWIPDFTLSGSSLSLGSGVGVDDGFKIEAVLNIRTQDSNDEEFLRTSHTMILQYDERSSSSKGTGLLLTDCFILLYTYNNESETDTSENMTELESEVPFNDSIYDTRLRGIAEPISNHDAVNKKYVDDNYVSVNNVKTVNGQSLLGNGDLEIQGLKTYTFDYNNYNTTLTQEELNKILEADKIYIKHDDILVEVTSKNESDRTLTLTGYNNRLNNACEYLVNIDKLRLTCFLLQDNVILLVEENSTAQIDYHEIICPNIEDGLVISPPSINIDKINILIIIDETLNKKNFLYINNFNENNGILTFYGKYTDTSLLKATFNDENQTLTFNIIEQSGGNSSSGGAYALVEHDTNDTTYTLTPNTFHVWGEVDSLTLTLGNETSGVANEYLFQFTSGTTATTLSLPSNLKWANDSAPTIESNMIYQVSILKGLASVLGFNNVSIISFNINVFNTIETHNAEEGMTWEEWVNSKYNTKDYQVMNSTIVDRNYSYYVTTDVGSTSLVSLSAVISAEHEYGNYLTGGGGGGS